MSKKDPEELKQQVVELAFESQKQGLTTAWFDVVYAQAQGNTAAIPWAYMEAHPMLQNWLARKTPSGTGKKALVIGCGLGDDAEALAAIGFQVTAFDISPTAIAWCHQRFPDSLVNYLVADLFSLDQAWDKAFDLVIESRTIQSLPLSVRTEVIKAIVRLVAPHGILLVITHVSHSEKLPDEPPWPLSESELSQLKNLGCHENERINFEIDGIQQLCLEYSH